MTHNIIRMSELTISPEANALNVTNIQLFNSIADHVDLETVTNHELREIFFIVRKQLSHLNWQDLVAHAVNHLPFGLNQTGIAWEGHHPCEGCPDAMIEAGSCYHQGECKSWEIYEARI